MNGKHRKPSTLVNATLQLATLAAGGAALTGLVTTSAQASVAAHEPARAAAAPIKNTVQHPALKIAKNKAKHTVKKDPKAKAAKLPKKLKAADVINLAKKQVGIKENGSGSTKFQNWYMSTYRADETVKRDGGSVRAYKSAAWCSMFISWLGVQLDFKDQMGWDAWTVKHASWFASNHRWGTKPKPGAVVFFDWDGGKDRDGIDHVGLVVKDNGNGTVDTVEGNISNAVQAKKRSTDTIVGYGYPTYAK